MNDTLLNFVLNENFFAVNILPPKKQKRKNDKEKQQQTIIKK